MKITLIIGTRPQIIKSAPIILAASKMSCVDLQIVHTGQHYDYNLSRIFFNEFNLPDPILNLEIGSGTHAKQTGNMMIGLEKALIELVPDLVMVPGDTNSTLAAALVSAKMGIPIAHIESGARSFNMKMPEEINRHLTDHCSQILFVVSENCRNNLLKEGIAAEKIFFVGDTMYESLQHHMHLVLKNKALDTFGLHSKEYSVLSIHRADNVDNSERLQAIMQTLMGLKDTKIIFPCHPRTKVKLMEIKLLNKISQAKNIQVIEPVGYHTMLNLMMHAKMVFTDSGGMQKEAFWLSTPCITLRDNTEWIETIELGANILVGSDPLFITDAVKKVNTNQISKEKISVAPNPYYLGEASNLILFNLNEFARARGLRLG